MLTVRSKYGPKNYVLFQYSFLNKNILSIKLSLPDLRDVFDTVLQFVSPVKFQFHPLQGVCFACFLFVFSLIFISYIVVLAPHTV